MFYDDVKCSKCTGFNYRNKGRKGHMQSNLKKDIRDGHLVREIS